MAAFRASSAVTPAPSAWASSALDILGDKWTLLIVRDLVFEGKDTYGQYLGSAEGIATNILANRLDLLEEAGIIKRLPHADKRTKSRFKLTKQGIDLVPMMMEMILWSDAHLKISPAAKQMAGQLRSNKQAVIDAIMAGLQQRK